MDKKEDILMDGIDERIESFLRGAMSREEEIAFKQEIRESPELRIRANTIASLVRGLHAHNKSMEETIIKENTEKRKIRPILWWACSIAAVFAIFFGIYKENQYRILDSTVSPYYYKYDISNISRGDIDSDTVEHLYGIFNKVQEDRNMSDVIKELEPIYSSLDDNFTYNAYANDISWNLALAYVKDNQIDKAITILQKLKNDNPDTPLYDRADELIKKLQEL